MKTQRMNEQFNLLFIDKGILNKCYELLKQILFKMIKYSKI